ncbi:Asp-tRNA(Asn)/Glu-tRNA(Gln) amidotransferase subunit GatB [Candidatus Gottesmanbacteria bacterium]|nr:Asp-tRNA(Asn)/Glu-tRNA(Gln) amidotransferase subunit GatB [Candidatus Gottesmanbacteria bacterium]
MDRYEPIIGLEIHVELKTLSKMFCGCSSDYFGHDPNTHCCPVCLGLPGALPVPNKKAIEWCVMLGMALGCKIPLFSKFDRKNYFYPDLPKGYQISQYDKPLAINGKLSFSYKDDKTGKIEKRVVRIHRVHLEEDTGKLLHAKVNAKDCTLIDFNRSGVPLVEIVTEPDIRSSIEARGFLKKLYQVIRYIGISDADMEKGSMRLEPNISERKIGEGDLPKYKVEVKNINSFKFAKKAIDYEVKRHTEILEKGQVPKQETRGWDEKKGVTFSQRSKEEAHDYRYFPEPDIPPIRWTEKYLQSLKESLPELPGEKIARFMKEYGLSEYDSAILTDEVAVANYFENSIKMGKDIQPKTIANWMINKKVTIEKVLPGEFINQIAKTLKKPAMDEKEVVDIIKQTISENEKAVQDYKSGKENALMFLLGQLMRKTSGRIDAETAKKLLKKNLG